MDHLAFWIIVLLIAYYPFGWGQEIRLFLLRMRRRHESVAGACKRHPSKY
jgi:hypothetical protein